MASPRTSQIYVPLLDEGTDVWRPVAAEHIKDDIYRIVGETPADERWQFVAGQVVRVRQQTLSGNACLAAYETDAV